MSTPEGAAEGTPTTADGATVVIPEQSAGPATGPETADETETVEYWKRQSRRNEERYKKEAERAAKAAEAAKVNAQAATAVKSAEQRVAELEQRETERAARDKERSAKHALSQVRATIAGAGIKPADADGFLEHIPGDSLLDEETNEVDEAAVKRLAQSVIKLAGRISPDPDQGQRGGSAKPNDMSSIIRRAAGVIS